MDDLLLSVKANRRGDIMCVYMLSLAMGIHTCVHMKNNKVWSTLHAVPLLHEELVEQCQMHLVYLRFGIFLRLVRRPPIEVRTLPVLGAITSDDPAVLTGLKLSTVTEHKPTVPSMTIPVPGTTAPVSIKTPRAMAAAGSAEQLPRVEAEMKQEPPADPPNVPFTPSLHKPQVELYPFNVNITRLTQKEIDKYMRKSHKTLVDEPKLKQLSIKVQRLPIQPNQTVTLAPPKAAITTNGSSHPLSPSSLAVTRLKTRQHQAKSRK